MGYVAGHMPIMDFNPTRYITRTLLFAQLTNLSFCTGIAHQLSQQEPEPELHPGAALPVTVIDEDEDGEDFTGLTVKVCVELAKTISE